MIKSAKEKKYYLIGLVIILFFVSLPFIYNWGNFISGIDYTFIEIYSNIFLERMSYAWSVHTGAGLPAPPIFFGNLIYIPVLSVLSKFLSPNITQIIMFSLFFALAYTGVYLYLHLFSKEDNDKEVNEFLISLLSIFYCINLINYTFFNIPLYFFLSFFAFTPLLMWVTAKILLTNRRRYKILYILLFSLNLITFLNLANIFLQIVLILVSISLFVSKKNYNTLFLPFLFSLLLLSPILYENYTFFKNPSVTNNQIQIDSVKAGIDEQIKYNSIINIFQFKTGFLELNTTKFQKTLPVFKLSNLYFNNQYSIILFIPFILLLFSLITERFDFEYKNKLLIIYSFLLLFIILILGAGFNPLSDLFVYIYTNIPYYGIFRSAIKFSIPLSILFITAFYIQLKNKKFCISIFAIYMILLTPYVLQGQLFNNLYFTNIPKDYSELEKNISSLDNNGIGLIYPNSELMYAYKWDYKGYSPFIFFQNEIPLFFKGTDITNSSAFIFNNLKDDNIKKNTITDLQKYNIKYIFFHKDIYCESYGICKNIDETRAYFDKNFKLIYSKDFFNIYEIFPEKVVPIQSKNLFFQKTNSVKYKIAINHSKKQDLIFLKSFSEDWKLYLNPDQPTIWCMKIENYKNTQTSECKSEEKFFEGEEFSYFWKKPIFDSSHRVMNGYANVWTIDPEYIIANYPQEYYKRYPDGSIDIELTLYYKPQSYFYLGIIIYALTFIGCIGYLVWWKKDNY